MRFDRITFDPKIMGGRACIRGMRVPVSVIVGQIAHGASTEEVLKDAELAMYHAKCIGGDRIEVFKPSMRARQSDRVTLESELRRALEREEITILYQPIVRLEDRSVAGFEVMPRWRHPKVARASPAEFIAMAEEVGLIVDLAMFVVERAARQLSGWQRAVRRRDRRAALPGLVCNLDRPDQPVRRRRCRHHRSSRLEQLAPQLIDSQDLLHRKTHHDHCQ